MSDPSDMSDLKVLNDLNDPTSHNYSLLITNY